MNMYQFLMCSLKCDLDAAVSENVNFTLQSFSNLAEQPKLVDLTVEEGQRLKVVYGSTKGFHAIDLDTSQVFDIYIPSHVSHCHNRIFGRQMFNIVPSPCVVNVHVKAVCVFHPNDFFPQEDMLFAQCRQ